MLDRTVLINQLERSMKESKSRDQEVKEAIQVAEGVVRSEKALAKISSLNAPLRCIEEARDVVGERMAELSQSSLAKKLLPQARVILDVRNRRIQYLEFFTFLGDCSGRFKDLAMECAYSGSEDSGFLTRENALQALETAINTSDKMRTITSLADIFQIIIMDLVERLDEVPPLAPRYRIPHDKSPEDDRN
jgi:hypothetical protein